MQRKKLGWGNRGKPHRKIELNFEGNVGLIWEKEGKGKRMDFFHSSVKRPSLFSGGLWGARYPAGCWQNELSLENAAMESFSKKELSDRESSRNRGEALKMRPPRGSCRGRKDVTLVPLVRWDSLRNSLCGICYVGCGR